MLKIAWNEMYAHPLPQGHRFPMSKYELLPEQLMFEGTCNNENFFSPKAIAESDIVEVHKEEYWIKLRDLEISPKDQRKTGFPHSKQLIEREILIMGGTVQCALHALEKGVSMNIAGGTHHAFTNRGEGFCLLNDLALSANYLLRNKLVRKILIVDLDVHQGNGTAEIFQSEPRVFTFSMHGESNYPLHKEKSDLDIGLPNGISDTPYLKLLDKNLKHLMQEVEPDFVLYQCGVDILETDKLGKLSVSIVGCKKRDEIVLSLCKNHDVPICCVMGGGYSERVSHIIDAHANTFRLAQDLFF